MVLSGTHFSLVSFQVSVEQTSVLEYMRYFSEFTSALVIEGWLLFDSGSELNISTSYCVCYTDWLIHFVIWDTVNISTTLCYCVIVTQTDRCTSWYGALWLAAGWHGVSDIMELQWKDNQCECMFWRPVIRWTCWSLEWFTWWVFHLTWHFIYLFTIYFIFISISPTWLGE